MVSHVNDSNSKASETSQIAAEVVFVGNHCNFSDSLIAATSQELGGITSVLFDSFAKFRRMVGASQGSPRALVLDEPTLRGLSTDDREFIKGVADLSLGLAFTTWEFGIASHADPLFRSSRASLFPLNVRLDVWLSVVRLIAHGGNYVCPEVISSIKAEDHSPLAGDGSLTRRQMDVLRLVADGQSNKLIAETLGLSIHTVKLHLHNGSARLGARNRTEAALRYREMYR